jgi:hypothetical protein
LTITPREVTERLFLEYLILLSRPNISARLRSKSYLCLLCEIAEEYASSNTNHGDSPQK